jgi:bacillithiol system protein YtxJ
MEPRQLEDAPELDQLLEAPRILFFKHSLICPVSLRAFAEYRRFLEPLGERPTVWLDVIGQRPLAQLLTRHTGVTHESPQALLLEHGEVRWHASHDAITVQSLAVAFDAKPLG